MWNETLARSTRRRMSCSWNNERLHFPGNSCDSMRSQKPTKDCKQTMAHWLPWQPTTWHPSHCHRLPWGLFGFFVDFFLLLAMVMWCGGLKSGAVSTVGFGRVTFGAGIKESLGTYTVTGVDYYCFFFFYRHFRFLMILHQAQNFIDQRQRGSGLRKEVFMDEWNHWWGNTALMGQWMISHVR